MDLGLEVAELQGDAVLSVHGEIDMASAPQLREQLIELIAQGHRQIIVDLERVEFLDCTGLGVLVSALKGQRRHHGDLALVCTQRRILKVFEVAGLTKVFRVHDTVDSALAARRSH
jgi:anti-sigma B factor antagonist